MHSLATTPTILEVVSDLLGPDVLIWKSQLWIKEAGSGSHVGWHQDSRYWGLTPIQSCNVWLAITDVEQANGPMEFLSGSHRAPLPTVDTYQPENLLTRGQAIDFGGGGGGPDPNLVVPDLLRYVTRQILNRQ